MQALTLENAGLKDAVNDMKVAVRVTQVLGWSPSAPPWQAAVETVQAGFIQAQATQARLGSGILDATKLFTAHEKRSDHHCGRSIPLCAAIARP